MSIQSEVIRYLRTKTPTGYSALTYLGAEQRFVSALKNSNLNNLEEQLIIGTDTYTTFYTNEEGKRVEEKEFHINSTEEEYDKHYYKLVSIYEQEDKNQGSVSFEDGEALIIASDGENFVFDNDDTGTTNFILLLTEKLYYVSEDEEELVFTKTIEGRYLNNKKIIKESIQK